MKTWIATVTLALTMLIGTTARAQDGGYDPAAVIRAQAAAIAPLSMFDGAWRGPATIQMPGGKALQLVQTERVGPMLDGSVRSFTKNTSPDVIRGGIEPNDGRFFNP